MRRYKYILPVLAMTIFQVVAQEDTTINRQIQVQEVTVNQQTANGASRKENQGSDLQQLTDRLMENLPEVTMIKRGNYAQEPTIRGLNNGQINTTIDGMRIFGACTDRMDPISSYVEPNNMQSIRISAAPGEDQLSSTLGGGVDFNLRKAVLGATRMFEGRVGAGYESNGNAKQILAGFQFSRKRFAIQLNSIYREAQNYNAGGNREILFSQYHKWNLAGNVALALSKHHFLRADYLQDDGRDIGYPALTMDVSFANMKMGALSHEYRNSGKRLYFVETKIYCNFIDHAMDDTKRPAEEVFMHMDMPGTSQTAGAYNFTSWKLSEKNHLKVKLTAYRNDLHAEMTMYPDLGAKMFMLTIPDARRYSGAINVSDKILSWKNLQITVGAGAEYLASSITTLLGRQTLSSMYLGELEKSKLLYSGYVQSNYKAGKKWNISAGISKSMRNATLQEMYGFYLYNRVDAYDYIGNPDLRPEQSWNANMGASFGVEKLKFETRIFGYFFTDYVSGEVQEDYSAMTFGALGVKQYVNIPTAMLYGGEFTAHWQIIKNFHLHSVNSISIGQDDAGSALPFVPPFKTRTSLEYNFKGFRFRAEYHAAAAQNRVDTEKYGERSTPSFHVMNAAVGKKFAFGRYYLLADLRMDNIFDAVFYEHLDVMKIPRQGRNFIFHLTFLF